MMIKQVLCILTLVFALLTLQGCAPEIGSPEWCAAMQEKPKGDWSINQAKDYAKYCLF